MARSTTGSKKTGNKTSKARGKKSAASTKSRPKKAFGKSSSHKAVAHKTRKALPAKNAAKKTAIKKSASKKPALKKSAAKKPALAKVIPPRPKREPGMSEQILEAALKVLDERQAEEIFTVDLAGKSSMADYLVIGSGRASRQLSAIAHYLREAFEKLGLKNIRVEGLADANWVLVDAGDVIVHLFRPEVRSYYNLESIWKDPAASKA